MAPCHGRNLLFRNFRAPIPVAGRRTHARIRADMDERESPLIAVRYPAWSRFWQSVLPGILDYMGSDKPWRLQTEDNSYGEMESVRIDERWQGTGAVLFRASGKELEAYRSRGMAVVLTSTEGPDCGYPRVVPDNEAVGRHAATHLLETGVQEFAFLARGETLYAEDNLAPGKRRYALERLRGFSGRLAAEGIQPRTHLLKGYPLWEADAWRGVREETARFLLTLPSPCGLFVVDDALAAVALRAAEDIGRTVPDTLLVVSYGDDPQYCHSQFPALSTIPHPGRRVGFEAAELLDLQLRGRIEPGLVRRIPVEGVIARGSTDALPIKDAEIARVLAWIRQRAPTDPLQVGELAEHCGLSVSAINSRFRQVIGHGPKQEIQMVRLKRLKQLLRTTDRPLGEIGMLMGFASAHELSRFFLRETGTRPNVWRSQQQVVNGSAAAI